MRVKLSRKSQVLNRLLRNLTSSLILDEQITTTLAKAKATKSWYEGLSGQLDKDEFNAIRKLKLRIGSEIASKKILELSKVKFPQIAIYKLGNRSGDNAPMARLVLDIKQVPEKDKKEAKNAKQK